ncbi:MAG: hypothetical protein H0W83_15465, partial [Planctomycetes bacterium]|nr:hypothetical protein [Planctomycetota bacterium]
TEPARSRVAVGWIAIVVGSVVLVAVPLMTVAWDARAGLAILVRDDIRHEVGASVLFAAAAATCAWLAARPLRDLTRAGRIGGGIAVAACLPGLCGSLAVGLAGLALIQLPALRWLSETPVPLIGALTLLMLPIAIALRIVLDRPDPALHLARMHVNSRDRAAGGSTLLWRLSGSRRYWAWSLLFLMGYADLAASAILHPVDMVPVLVMLYNFMHYGQSSALSARLGAAMCAPVVVIVGGWIIVRLGATVTGWLRSARPGAARA